MSSPFGPAAGDPRGARFVCPRCGKASSHPQDKALGYCGACKAFTGPAAGPILPALGDDPRTRPGAMAGPDASPYSKNSTVIDARNALYLERADCERVVVVGHDRATGAPQQRVRYLLSLAGNYPKPAGEGRQLPDPDNPGRLQLADDVDGQAAVVSELFAVFARHDIGLHDAVHQLVGEHLGELAARDAAATTGHDDEVIATAMGAALIPESFAVVLLLSGDPQADLAPPAALEWTGRVNKTDDRASVVVLASTNRVVGLLAQILHAGMGDDTFTAAVAARVAALRADGDYPQRRRQGR